jgi:hypothetical protein
LKKKRIIETSKRFSAKSIHSSLFEETPPPLSLPPLNSVLNSCQRYAYNPHQQINAHPSHLRSYGTQTISPVQGCSTRDPWTCTTRPCRAGRYGRGHLRPCTRARGILQRRRPFEHRATRLGVIRSWSRENDFTRHGRGGDGCAGSEDGGVEVGVEIDGHGRRVVSQ